MPPISYWGQKYVFSPFAARQIGDIGKVLAAANNTQIKIGNLPPITLSCGQTHTFEIPSGDEALALTSNKPVLCGHFNKGQGPDLNTDPFFIILPPLDALTVKEVTISGMNLGAPWTHFTSIVTPASNRANVSCTCGPLQWLPVIGNPDFVHARSAIAPGNATITSLDQGFIASVYGNADIDSYGYAGAASVVDTAFSISGPRFVCLNDSVTFRAGSLFAIDRIRWLSEGNPLPTFGAEIVITPTTCGEKQLVAQFGGANEFCDTTTQFCVVRRFTVFEKPNIAPLPLTVLPCPGAPFRFPFRLTGFGCEGQNYRWQIDFTVNGAPQPPIFGQGNGDFSFPIPPLSQDAKLEITRVQNLSAPAANRCAPISYPVIPLALQPTFPPALSVSSAEACIGQSVIFQVTNPDPQTTYTWSFSGAAQQPNALGAGPISNFWQASGMVTATVTATPSSSCPATQNTVAVRILPTPQARFMGPDTLCISASANFTLALPPSANTIYQWLFSGGVPLQSIQASPPPVSWAAPGRYAVQLVAIQNGCTSAPFIKPIQVLEPPSALPIFLSSPPYCRRQPITFEYLGGVTPGQQIAWFIEEGSFSLTALGKGPHSFIPGNQGNAVKITLSVAESSCSRDTSFSIPIFSLPVVSLLVSKDSICTDAPLVVQAELAPGSQATSYAWQCDGCNAGAVDWTTAGPFTISWSGPGVKTLTLRAINQGCETLVAPYFVNALPRPDASFSLPDSVCVGGFLTLQYSGGAPLGDSLTIFDGFCSGCSPASFIGRAPTPPSGWQIMQSGNHTFRLRATQAGCSSAIKEVDFKSYYLPLSLNTNAPICSGQSLRLSAQSVVGASIQWSGPQGFSAIEAFPEINNAQSSASGWYIAEGVYQGCRTEKKTLSVAVTPLPLAPFISGDTLLCKGETAILQVALSSGAAALWRDPQGQAIFTNPLALPSVTERESGLYQVAVIQNQCTSETAKRFLQVIAPEPLQTSAPILKRCQAGTLTFTLVAPNGYAISLFDSTNALIQLKRSPPFSFTLTDLPLGKSRWIAQGRVPQGCLTEPLFLETQVFPTPTAPAVAPVTLCGLPPQEVIFGVANPAPHLRYSLYEAGAIGFSEPLATSSVEFSDMINIIQAEAQKNYEVVAIDTLTDCASVGTPTYARLLSRPEIRARGNSRCGGGRLTFTLFLENGEADSLFLYSDSMGQERLAAWNIQEASSVMTFTTPPLTQSVTYYVGALQNDCGLSSLEPLILETAPLLMVEIERQPAGGSFPPGSSLANIRVDGGFPPYRFQLEGGLWQTESTFGPLLPGEYMLRVGDSRNCIAEKRFRIENVVNTECRAPAWAAWRSTTGGNNSPLIFHWASAPGALAYRVTISLGGAQQVIELSDTVWNLANLQPLQRYEVTVQSICALGKVSEEKVRLTTTTGACPPVTGWEVTQKEAGVTGQWERDISHSYYQLIIEGPSILLDTFRLAQSFFEVNGLQAGGTYKLRLTPFCAGGSIQAPFLEKNITLVVKCPAVTHLRWQNGFILWDAPATEGYTMLRYRLKGTSSWQYINANSPFEPIGLQIGSLYQAQARRVCNGTDVSEWSTLLEFVR
jgi:hypothetical protein